ncbi:hypothetical protein PIB30_014736 [Stylosanthes scabra]|uniref:Uncharacterized protein n=1 Tax=Stylosanthes scabra TaxID=79078 RepID=A0ABU6X537_9FABA|nr:hypothetical protein [Stylosanthes scabra]
MILSDDPRFLWRVGAAIGTMLKIDKTTSIHSKEKYARICVEIDLSKQFVPRISILYGHWVEHYPEAPPPPEDHPDGTTVNDNQDVEANRGTVDSNQKPEDYVDPNINKGQSGPNPSINSQDSPNFGP